MGGQLRLSVRRSCEEPSACPSVLVAELIGNLHGYTLWLTKMLPLHSAPFATWDKWLSIQAQNILPPVGSDRLATVSNALT